MPRERQGSLGGWLFFFKDYDSEPLGDTGGRERGKEGREEHSERGRG